MLSDGWTDRQTDIKKLTVVFHSFPNVPKNANSGKVAIRFIQIGRETSAD